MIEMLFKLLVVHALCDYPLQGDFMAKAKNPSAPINGVPWAWPMAAHAAIHAGGVYLVTGSPACAIIEFWLHALMDYAKCVGLLTFARDQAVHVVCKVAYAIALGGAK